MLYVWGVFVYGHFRFLGAPRGSSFVDVVVVACDHLYSGHGTSSRFGI